MSRPVTTNCSTPPLSIREATLPDAPRIHRLINDAFNSDTTDQVFLTPTRVDIFPLEDTTTKISSDHTIVLIATTTTTSSPSDDTTIVATCYVRQHPPDSAWLGTLCIDPARHKQGIGGYLLREAEQYVVAKWGVKGICIDVVSTRTELMAWYQRCGYVKTGNERPFPYGGAPEGWLREGMKMVDLRKVLVKEEEGKGKAPESGEA
jgi:ribosomal protein S18 acetylase RimI-like enzyme